MTPEKSVERSVDTLQRIYAVVAALAANEALKRAFIDKATDTFQIRADFVPELLAFIVTLVPFVHGMNRHLDTVLTKSKDNRPRLLNYLLLDFFVFLAESSLLFVLALSIPHGVVFFRWLLVLLLLDVVWASVTWQITKSAVLPWVTVNLVAVLLGLIVIYVPRLIGDPAKPWVLALIAGLRTLADYRYAWSFYFPCCAVPDPPPSPAI